MTPIEHQISQTAEEREPLPLSLLNDYLYCPRRAALKLVEGWRSANEHTARGDIVHDHADLPGYEVAKGVTLLRALPVWSERLGLSGKCDIVEAVGASPDLKSQISDLKSSGIAALRLVEYKKGKRRQFDNDDAQLCAQALCLEEMFGLQVPHGAVFHAESKRRREVEFTAELRASTEQAVAELHRLMEAQSIPAAPYIEGRCEECSLYEICLPKATCAGNRAVQLSRKLFET